MLAQAIRRCSSTLQNIYLQNNPLGDEGVQTLIQALHLVTTHCLEISLSSNSTTFEADIIFNVPKESRPFSVVMMSVRQNKDFFKDDTNEETPETLFSGPTQTHVSAP